LLAFLDIVKIAQGSSLRRTDSVVWTPVFILLNMTQQSGRLFVSLFYFLTRAVLVDVSAALRPPGLPFPGRYMAVSITFSNDSVKVFLFALRSATI
jgi:hypothetical protein